MVRWFLFSTGLIITALVAITMLALESEGVVTVETFDRETGKGRNTHVWYARVDGTLYLEAGKPGDPWVRDLEFQTTIKLRGEGLDGQYDFIVRSDRESHTKIRSIMREKYGWRDRWIESVFDLSKSMLIELKKSK